jgi:hypothetical protein
VTDTSDLAAVAAFIESLRKMGVKTYTDGRISVTFEHEGQRLTPSAKPPARPAWADGKDEA